MHGAARIWPERYVIELCDMAFKGKSMDNTPVSILIIKTEHCGFVAFSFKFGSSSRPTKPTLRGSDVPVMAYFPCSDMLRRKPGQKVTGSKPPDFVSIVPSLPVPEFKTQSFP